MNSNWVNGRTGQATWGRASVWAAGAVLHALLTGHPPGPPKLTSSKAQVLMTCQIPYHSSPLLSQAPCFLLQLWRLITELIEVEGLVGCKQRFSDGLQMLQDILEESKAALGLKAHRAPARTSLSDLQSSILPEVSPIVDSAKFAPPCRPQMLHVHNTPQNAPDHLTLTDTGYVETLTQCATSAATSTSL